MLTYIIAGIITFVFTTILTIAGVGTAFILVSVFLALGIPLLTAMPTVPVLNSIAMIFAPVSYAREKLIISKSALPVLAICVIGSVSGALLGAHLLKKKLSGKQVKTVIGIILYLIAAKMIWDLLK